MATISWTVLASLVLKSEQHFKKSQQPSSNPINLTPASYRLIWPHNRLDSFTLSENNRSWVRLAKILNYSLADQRTGPFKNCIRQGKNNPPVTPGKVCG